MPPQPLAPSDRPWRAEMVALLQTAWRLPGVPLDEAAELRGDQWRAVMQQIPVAALCCLILMGLVAVQLGHAAATGAWPALLGLATLTHLCNLTIWWRARAAPADGERSNREIALLGLDQLLTGALTAAVLVAYAGHADPSLAMVVVAVCATVVAVGAWVLALLPAAALGWTVGAVIGITGGILALPVPTLYPVLTLLPVLLVALGAAILLNAQLYLRGRLAQRELARQGELVSLLLRDFEAQASDWLWEIDAAGRLRRVSDRLAERLGQPAPGLIGRRLIDLLQELSPPGEAPTDLARLTRALERTQSFRDLDIQVNVAGRRSWWSLSGHRLDDGLAWRGVGSDVTPLREREAELRRLASFDPLTGLANRNAFNQRLAEHLSDEAAKAPCTLLLLDLDNFKQVNDSLGHGAGDTLLRVVAQRLSESLIARRGTGDLVARLGGDEFALVLRGALEEPALQRLGKQLRSALAVPVAIEHHEVNVAASFGAARAPLDAQSPEELMRGADLALYAAKADGRNRLRLFEPEMRSRAIDRAGLLDDLRSAMSAGQIELHYQPQVDLMRGRLLGFEALVRWRHPKRGLVPPVDFVPLAEDSGLILALGEWVVAQACRDAEAWPGELSVAVNVSAVEFERSPLERQISAALEASGLAPARLVIELTESALLRDSESAITLLRRLRQLGLQIALDDFGTGFSSLAYLRRLPLDKLKIDRAFVTDLDRIGASATGQAIVQAIHELARALGLSTVAEGVETAEQHEILARLGCRAGQGYRFAPALTAAQALDFIHQAQTQGLDAAQTRFGIAPRPQTATPVRSPRLAPPGSLPDTRWSAMP